MKWHFIPLLIFLFSSQLPFNKADGQTKDSIYYFLNPADSNLIGVKDRNNQIIIPAVYYNLYELDSSVPIIGPIVEFGIRPKNRSHDTTSPAIPITEVYNRKGQFLYYAQFFDNGSDYFVEGLRRYVNNKKIGFVNKLGEKKIAAQWDFATPFNYGYATVYAGGWKKKLLEGGEHWIIVPASKKSYSYVINNKGRKVQPLAKQERPGDYPLEGHLYPYPFKYNAKEQGIRDHLNNQKGIKEIGKSRFNIDTSKTQFEIVERPTTYFPYYILQGYSNGKAIEALVFLADPTGRQFYHYNNSQYSLKQLDLKTWIKNETLN